MKPELLPCPFCGGDAIKSEEDLFAPNTCNKYVWCKKCGTTSGLQIDHDFAVAAWNRRGGVPVVAASIDLQEKIDAICKLQAHNDQVQP